MKFWDLNKNIKIRLFLQFFGTIATASVIPYLVVYFENRLGVIITGFMFFGVIAVTIVGSIIGGYYSDRLGRKQIILLSELIIFASYLVVAMINSPWANYPYISFILILIISFFSGMVNPAYQALIIDASTADNRKYIYTFSYWLNNLGIAIGGIIGAFLFKEYIFALFLGVSFINLISFFITLFFITETYKPNPVSRTSDETLKKNSNSSLTSMLSSFLNILKNKKFTALIIANIFILSLESHLTNYIEIRLDNNIFNKSLLPFVDFQVDGIKMIGILRTENTLLVVFLTVLVSIMLRKLKDRSVFLSGLILYTFGYVIISYSTEPWILLIAMFFASIGELMHIPVKQTLVANMVPDDARSSYMAVYGLSSTFASIITGLFIFLGAFVEPLIITGIILVMGLLSIVIFHGIFKAETVDENKNYNSSTPY